MVDEYTPEPWECTTLIGHVFANERLVANCRGHDDSSDRHACQRENEANARRIVACVNACQGIVTDLVEGVDPCELNKAIASVFGGEDGTHLLERYAKPEEQADG